MEPYEGSPQSAGVIITMDQIYNELQAVHSKVNDIGNDVKDIADHETRIRALERKVWIAAGTASGFTGAIVAFISWLVQKG